MTPEQAPDNSPRQVTRNQHFVPKFYLKRFADTKAQVQVFEPSARAIRKPRPYAGVCYDRFFYALETGNKMRPAPPLRTFSQHLENAIAEQYDELVEKRRLALCQMKTSI